jgi:predicted DCC family thiol-disulfide oxidoreductase YuxK
VAYTLLYDDNCNICKVITDAVLSWDGRRGVLQALPIQSDGGRRLLAGVAVERHLETFHVVAADGVVASGGPALALLLSLLPGGAIPGRVLDALPKPTAAAYAWVARNRVALSRWVPSRLKRRASRRLRRPDCSRS